MPEEQDNSTNTIDGATARLCLLNECTKRLISGWARRIRLSEKNDLLESSVDALVKAKLIAPGRTLLHIWQTHYDGHHKHRAVEFNYVTDAVVLTDPDGDGKGAVRIQQMKQAAGSESLG